MIGKVREQDLKGQLITLLGGSGFVGTHLAQQLLRRGARLRLASRRPEQAYRLKPLGNLGQLQFVRFDISRPESVAAVVRGSDAVVNLVGSFSGDLDAVQGSGLAVLGSIARQSGVKALVHISAIGADPDSATAYGRSKAAGESALRETFPAATFLRPSVLFGQDDSFVNLFARLIARLPVVPVFGPDKPLQPLLVDDAAQAITASLAHPVAHGGRTYELGGPEVMTMLDLHHRIAEAQSRPGRFLALPDAASMAFATLTGWLPFAPLSRDQWRMLAVGNVAAPDRPGIAELGIQPRPLGLYLERWMVQYRVHGRFGQAKTSPR